MANVRLTRLQGDVYLHDLYEESAWLARYSVLIIETDTTVEAGDYVSFTTCGHNLRGSVLEIISEINGSCMVKVSVGDVDFRSLNFRMEVMRARRQK